MTDKKMNFIEIEDVEEANKFDIENKWTFVGLKDSKYVFKKRAKK